MTTLDRMEEWTRRNTDGSKTHELHLWVSDLETPARPRHRARDAAAGAIGEVTPGRPIPNGAQDPPEQRGRGDQQQPEEFPARLRLADYRQRGAIKPPSRQYLSTPDRCGSSVAINAARKCLG
jgi:hypothetical protein